MTWIRCGTCEIEYADGVQGPKCPHLRIGMKMERTRTMTRRQRPSVPFPAQFNGLCNGCFGEVEAGDEIVMWNGKAYHDDENCCDGLRIVEPVEENANRPRDRWA